MKFDSIAFKAAVAGVLIVGTVVAASIMTAVIVSNTKNKEILAGAANELSAKKDNLRAIENKKKAVFEEMDNQITEKIERCDDLDQQIRKKEIALKLVADGLNGNDSQKLVLAVVSGLQDSIVNMNLEMRKVQRLVEEKSATS